MTAILAKDLTHSNIMNLVTVEHPALVEGSEDTIEATSTGQLFSITQLGGKIYLSIGGQTAAIDPFSLIEIHSTHVGMLSEDLTDLVHDMTAVEAKNSDG